MEAIKIEAGIAIREAEQDAEHALNLTVSTAEEYRVAVETLKALVRRQKDLEAQRKRATAPLDESKKEIMGWYKPALDALERVIGSLRASVSDYQREQSERSARAIADYAATGDRAALVASLGESTPEVQGATTRVVWKFEIVDAAALPREYLIPDETRIWQIVRALKQDTAIPGVRAYPETVIAVGR